MSTLERFFVRPSIFCLALLLAGETPVPVTEHVQLRFDDIATAIAPAGAALNDRNAEVTIPRAHIVALSPEGLRSSAGDTGQSSAKAGHSMPQPAWVSDSAAAHAAEAQRRDRTTFRF